MHINPTPVDLAKGTAPDLTTLDRQMVIVLGFGSRRMYKGLGCVAAIQSHMPFKKIIVYDLGIHPKMVKKVCTLRQKPLKIHIVILACNFYKRVSTENKAVEMEA